MKIFNKNILYILMILILSFNVFGLTYTGDYTNFGTGTFNNVEISGQSLKLVNGFNTGTFESEIINFDELITTNNFQSIFYSKSNIDDLYLSSMISYYSFESTSGNFIDRSLNNNDLSNTNVNYNQVGKINNAVSYLGTDTSLSVKYPLNNAPNNAFSVVFWVKSSDTQDRNVFSYASTTEKRAIGLHKLNDIRIAIDGQDYDTNINLADNLYHHVGVTWASATGSTNVYVDGVLTSSFILKQGKIFTPNGALMIGQQQDSPNVVKSGTGFIGTIDEFGFYNRVLSDSEIKQIFGKSQQSIIVDVKSCDDSICELDTYTTLTTPTNQNLVLTENEFFRYRITLNGTTTSTPSFKSLLVNYSSAGAVLPVERKENQEYKRLGYDYSLTYNNDLVSFWNEATPTIEQAPPKAINNDENLVSPKVAYLGDGEKYIITYNDGDIILYQYDSDNKKLNIIDGYPLSYQPVGDIVIHDFGGVPNIVVPLGSGFGTNTNPQRVAFLTYDGQSFTYSDISTGTSYGRLTQNPNDKTLYKTLLNCYDDYCITTFQIQYNIPFVANYVRMKATLFNKNEIIDSYTDTSRSFLFTSGQGNCLFSPIGSNIVIDNVDNDFIDGEPYDYTDVVFNYIGVESNQMKVYTYSLDVFNDTISLDWVNQNSLFGSGSSCANYPYAGEDGLSPIRFATGVLAFNYDGVKGNGKEILYGAMKSSSYEDYKLNELTAQGTDFTEHPTIFNIKGQLLSNPVVLDCYRESGVEDIGILSYNEEDQKLELFCTCFSCSGDNDCLFKNFNEEISFNVSNLYSIGSSIHAFKPNSENKGSDIVTPMGIFEVEQAEKNLLGFCGEPELTKIYNVNDRDSIIIPVDYQNNGRADLIVQSSYSISYLDDGFSNSKPYINFLELNPCFDEGALKLDTQLQIKVKSFDSESDLVSYKIVTYAGLDGKEEISSWSSYMSPSTEYRYTTTLPFEIGVAYLEVYVKDSKHTESNLVQRIYSVNNNTNSKEFGDCIQTFNEEDLVGEQDTGESTTDIEYVDKYGNQINDNAIKGGLTTIGGLFGFGAFLTYLIIMGIIAISMFFYVDMGSGHGASKFGAIALVEFIALIVGVYLQIVPVVIMVMIMIVVLLLLSIWGGSYILMSRGANN